MPAVRLVFGRAAGSVRFDKGGVRAGRDEGIVRGGRKSRM